ncbi:MAG TPA: hypothetical protein VMH01_04905 [Puia sp.]|nr:hypothetical protein [Puia sp.]
MKKLIILSIAVTLLSLVVKAQNMPKQNLLLIHTIYLSLTPENMNVNVDSILKIYKQYIFDKNPYYLNTKIVKHWYGHDSREVLMISELKSWGDIEKADAKRTEIINELDKMPQMQKGGMMWFSLISPEHHSDEIYQVVAE